MLEITGDDIAELNDEDLRSLVGRLCESELRSRGLSTSAVTWGGNQNAADGGIDVRVRIEDGAPPGGFVPRTNIGFQVKKTDFTPALIAREMRPSDQLRSSISGLIDECGAYIIASSGADTSDSALSDRLDAMRSAVADHPGQAKLHLDFYDRNRLATWTRNHPGLVVWVRQRISRGIPGWQPYSSWAVSPDGVRDEYLLDDKASLYTGITDIEGIEVTQGIDRIRDILREVQGVVRLVGLSGVGKTRLVQALFDARVGKNPLDPALVIYTDMNDNPSPQPTGMISDLIASRTRAIVVIDNCAPDLHRRVTQSISSVWFVGPKVQEQFEAIAAEIAVDYYWQEGWIAIRSILARPPDEANVAAMERLRAFESRLRPKNVAERVRAVVLSRRSGAIDYAEMDADYGFEPEKLKAANEKANAAAEELGKAVCVDPPLFTALLPELVSGNAGRLLPFGKGLALASADRRTTWNQLTNAFANIEESERNVDALLGFLNGLSTVDQQLCETLLDESVMHETLAARFPNLQSAVTITEAGADRLKRAISLRRPRPLAFSFLGWRSDVSSDDLRTMVLSLAKQQHGYKVAIDILSMRLHSDPNEMKEYSSELVDAGRELLSSPDFSVRDNRTTTIYTVLQISRCAVRKDPLPRSRFASELGRDSWIAPFTSTTTTI